MGFKSFLDLARETEQKKKEETVKEQLYIEDLVDIMHIEVVKLPEAYFVETRNIKLGDIFKVQFVTETTKVVEKTNVKYRTKVYGVQTKNKKDMVFYEDEIKIINKNK